jgi:hypothetical protein
MDNFDRRAVIASAAIVGAVATATGSSAAAKRPPKPVPPAPAPEPVPPAPKPVLRPVNLVFFAINPNTTLTLTTIPFADYNPDFLVKFASAFISKVHEGNIPTSGYYILDAATGESL